MSFLDKLTPVQGNTKTKDKQTKESVPSFMSKLQPVDASQIQTETPKGGGVGGFLKSLVSAPLTMLARPIQAGAELLGASDESVNRVTSNLTGGLVAPTPQNFSDVKKDVGRGAQTIAFGLNPVAGGALFGTGNSLEQGNDLFSTETALQTVLGAGAGKVLDLIGKPLLSVTGKVIGKITPQIIKDVAGKGAGAIAEFAATHNILPEGVSNVVNKGADVVNKIADKPFDVAGNIIKKPFVKSSESIAAKNEKDLMNIENNYAKLRKNRQFSKDQNAGSRSRVANTDVMADSVDNTGTLLTDKPGGAIEQYKKLTVDGKEGVGRKILEKEGATVHLDDVEKELTRTIHESGLEGADLRTALNNVKKEIAGYRLKADAEGKIPLTLVHDAKISTTNGINFQTPPEIKTYRKSIARGLKETVEKYSKTNIGTVNKELSKFYKDIEYLQSLNGRKVQGGKLGKYFAQISGNIVGGLAGTAVGGPVGGAMGTVIGGEVAGRLKGAAFERTFGRTGAIPVKSKILQGAEDYSNSLGKRKAQYKNAAIPSKTNISPIIPPNKIKVKPPITPPTKGALNKIQVKITDPTLFKRDASLSPANKAVETKAFVYVLKNEDKILADYFKKHGKTINTDNFRPFFKEAGYTGENSAAVQEPSSYLRKRATSLALKNKGEYAVGTAGGSGVGKSSSARAIPTIAELHNNAAMTLDGNFSNLDSAHKFINEVRASGKDFIGVYTYREYMDSIENGIIKRALTNPEEMGRIVPNKETASNHPNSWETVKKLNDEGEQFHFIDNSLGAGKAQVVTRTELEAKIKYPPIEQLTKDANAIVKKLYESKKPFVDENGVKHYITKKQYEALIQ